MESLVSMFSDLETPPAPQQQQQQQPFRFSDLPSELRAQILGLVLVTDTTTVDLDANNHHHGRRRLHILLVSRRFHTEASQIFYGSNTFRVFPTNGRFMGDRVKPLVARLPERYRASLVSLELRLGPGWGRPPRSWRINPRLGLQDMKAVRVLKIYVQIDPSQDVYKGFRVSKDFYTLFCERLLEDLMNRLQSLARVEFDGWPSVMYDSTLMDTLFKVAQSREKQIVLAPGIRLFQKRAKPSIANPPYLAPETLLLT